MNRYTTFFIALKKLPGLTKEEAVYSFTNGAHNSLRKLTDYELLELTKSLQTISGGMEKKQYVENRLAKDPKADKMRKAIMAIFYDMNRTAADAKAWAEKQGVRGVKKKFNDYTTGELYTLINVAEKIKATWEKGIRKRL